MSYVEPLLNCHPLESSSTSPALNTYMLCSPFTSTLFPFFFYKHSFGKQPGRRCSPPCCPQPVSSGGGSEVGQSQGLSPPLPSQAVHSLPPHKRQHWLTPDSGQLGTKDARSWSHALCLSPGHVPAPEEERPPIHWRCPDSPSTDPAAAILTLPHCSGYTERLGTSRVPPSQGPPSVPLWPSWLRPFWLVWVV